MKSTHSLELERNVAELEKYLRQPRKQLNSASKRFLDHCLGSEENRVYERAKSIFAHQWANYTADERQNIDDDVAVFQKALGNLSACCDAHRDDKYCKHMGLDNMAWNVARKARVL
eukprot:5017958-Amphidinium_carterae.1